MTVAEAQARVSSAEFAEWQAFHSIEPFGPARGDVHAGIVAAAVTNASGFRKGKAVSPLDYMPDFDREPEDPDAAEKFYKAQAKIEALRKQQQSRPKK